MTKLDEYHTGNKYLRRIPANPHDESDVYDVLEAFKVTCPALQHAAKKVLCCGIRGKNNRLNDLKEARDALNRAIQLEMLREDEKPLDKWITKPNTLYRSDKEGTLIEVLEVSTAAENIFAENGITEVSLAVRPECTEEAQAALTEAAREHG